MLLKKTTAVELTVNSWFCKHSVFLLVHNKMLSVKKSRERTKEDKMCFTYLKSKVYSTLKDLIFV